jgi:uncharacterized protein DUF6193
VGDAEKPSSEQIWQWYRDTPDRPDDLAGLQAFCAAAAEVPRLRALYPFTSPYLLGFRRTAEYTPGIGLWVVPVGEGRYQVRGPELREYGEADAAGSVRLALTALDDIEAAQEGRSRPS